MDLQVNKLRFILVLVEKLVLKKFQEISFFQMVQAITVTICNQLVKTLASVFLATSDIQMDVAYGSMIIITVKRSMQKH